MSLFSDNIRHLREKKKISQEKLAEGLQITRERYVKYEYGTSEAPYDILKRIAHYYHISIDLLLSVDVRKIPAGDLLRLEGNRLVLPIMVDGAGENFIEVVTLKAKAGYMNGYADPEFIEGLQHITMPFLGTGKYRAFPVEGDSMPPHNDGSFIVGSYVESWSEISEGKTYVLLTRNEGIIFKRAGKKIGDRLMLHSDNTFYMPFEIGAEDILEVWAYACSIATSEFKPEDLSSDNIREMFMEIRKEIADIKRSGDKQK